MFLFLVWTASIRLKYCRVPNLTILTYICISCSCGHKPKEEYRTKYAVMLCCYLSTFNLSWSWNFLLIIFIQQLKKWSKIWGLFNNIKWWPGSSVPIFLDYHEQFCEDLLRPECQTFFYIIHRTLVDVNGSTTAAAWGTTTDSTLLTTAKWLVEELSLWLVIYLLILNSIYRRCSVKFPNRKVII